MTEPRRPLWVDAIILSLAFVIFVTMIGLGNWQVRRLAWKVDLIEAVETRAFAPEIAAPFGPVTEEDDEYTRVEVSGTFNYSETRRVKAVTDLGLGNWLLTPLEADERTIWINRGFIPQNFDGTLQEPTGLQVITGLLRITEPESTLLESNDPAAERWVARDVDQLSDAAGIGRFAPYFIDADHLTAPGTWPRGGLTIINFRNTHLSYALTWYAMALLFLGGMVYVIWDRVRARRGGLRLVHDAKGSMTSEDG
ncbi:MAG: SURF1 family protein [Pseudomonadota bacterium]